MGELELKAALQHEGEVQAAELWRQAESTVAARREQVEAERRQLRAESERQLQVEVAALRNNLLLEARTRAMKQRLHEEAALEKRLLLVACQLLAELADNDRSGLWKAICAELPATDWTTLKVHPADFERARRDFPAAEIVRDETLGGGLVASNADSTICIDNSLNCRLKRAWPDLLPKLFDELRKRVSDDETTRIDTTG